MESIAFLDACLAFERKNLTFSRPSSALREASWRLRSHCEIMSPVTRSADLIESCADDDGKFLRDISSTFENWVKFDASSETWNSLGGDEDVLVSDDGVPLAFLYLVCAFLANPTSKRWILG